MTRLRKKACAIPETTAPSDHTYALDFTSRQEVVRVDICPDSCQQPFSPCIDVPKPAMHLDFSHTIELVVDNFRVKISNAADPKLLAEILDGLCAIIKEEFSMDMDHALFPFCGLRCDGIKAILKEPDGIVLIYKRLTAQGHYRWPRDKSEVRNLTWKEFDWLMSGIDIDQPKAKGVMYVNQLFELEKKIRQKHAGDYEAIRKARMEKEKPVVDGFLTWLKDQSPTRGSRMAKAVTYIQNREPYLATYLEDGRCSFSNNLSENAIRPFVVGRKGWLFSDTPAGAETSAIIYTMVENAKANGVNVYQYLKLLLEKQPNNQMKDEELEKLAPWNKEVKTLLETRAMEED